jgi:hypothetical protein
VVDFVELDRDVFVRKRVQRGVQPRLGHRVRKVRADGELAGRRPDFDVGAGQPGAQAEAERRRAGRPLQQPPPVERLAQQGGTGRTSGVASHHLHLVVASAPGGDGTVDRDLNRVRPG